MANILSYFWWNLLTIKCYMFNVSLMSFSNARMITHVQTSIVIITLLHTCLMWSSFANIAEFVLRFDIYIVDNRINIFSGTKQNPNNMHSWSYTPTMLYGQQQKLFYGVFAGSPKYFFETNRKTHKQINKKSYLD